MALASAPTDPSDERSPCSHAHPLLDAEGRTDFAMQLRATVMEVAIGMHTVLVGFALGTTVRSLRVLVLTVALVFLPRMGLASD